MSPTVSTKASFSAPQLTSKKVSVAIRPRNHADLTQEGYVHLIKRRRLSRVELGNIRHVHSREMSVARTNKYNLIWMAVQLN